MKIAFTPVVYEHAARFVGRTPWEVSREADLMFHGHRLAYLEYHQQDIAVGIDIYNLEAEAYGAKIEPSEGNAIPAIHEPLLSTLEDGLTLQPFDPQRDRRIALLIGVGQRLKREFPEADVRIPVAGGDRSSRLCRGGVPHLPRRHDSCEPRSVCGGLLGAGADLSRH
jgi:hypothetical protein